MKRFAIIFAALFAAAFHLGAQEIVIPEGYELVDSLVFTPMSLVDQSLEGVDIYSALPSNVRLHQSQALRDSLGQHIRKNASRLINGYRIRIFFDNKQASRGESENVEKRFHALYRGYNTYRTFSSPFFKVTIGDFRTKSEANAALKTIRKDFPSALVVRERFRYPALDDEHYVVDTIKVIRPIQSYL